MLCFPLYYKLVLVPCKMFFLAVHGRTNNRFNRKFHVGFVIVCLLIETETFVVAIVFFFFHVNASFELD